MNSVQDLPEYSVVTCFLEHNGEVLLLQRAKQDSQFGLWGIPGGKLNENESPLEGLKREIKEELSLSIDLKQIKFLGSSEMRNECDGYYQLYLYYYPLSKIPKITINPVEHSDFAWVSIANFKKHPLLFCQGAAFDLVKEMLENTIKQGEVGCLPGIH